MDKEDYLIRLSILEQEANKIQEQINFINQQTQELEVLKLSLDKLEKGKEILAPLGRGIFFKSDVKSEDVFVNVGLGVVLKKKPKEAEKIINEQIKQLEEIKQKLNKAVSNINTELQDLVSEVQKSI